MSLLGNAGVLPGIVLTARATQSKRPILLNSKRHGRRVALLPVAVRGTSCSFHALVRAMSYETCSMLCVARAGLLRARSPRAANARGGRRENQCAGGGAVTRLSWT